MEIPHVPKHERANIYGYDNEKYVTAKKFRLINWLYNIFNSRNIYEFYLFEGNQITVDRDVKKMQDNGWELAGEISTQFSVHGLNRMLIPLKRRI